MLKESRLAKEKEFRTAVDRNMIIYDSILKNNQDSMELNRRLESRKKRRIIEQTALSMN